MEKFCPECGQKLALTGEGVEGAINVGNTSGDVLGTGVSGKKNVLGKEFAYAREGNAIVVNINNPSSQEIVEVVKNIIAAPTEVEQTSVTSKENIKAKLEESGAAQQQGIKAGSLQISTTELSLKEIILKGNEHYFKHEYEEAIKYYDKAIVIEPNNVYAWKNKGHSLSELGKNEEAIRCFTKALEIDPNNAPVWDNNGVALANFRKI
jgi:tetratricopeptide (TPR) repeat protein